MHTNIDDIPAGKNIPEDIYVIIEIAANSHPVKYEINKNTRKIFVDRFLLTPMFYPCNYGYINQTISLDGDPIDVLVITPYPLIPGCIIHSRPIGMLDMDDESGKDAKIIALPHHTLSQQYESIYDIDHLPSLLRNQINYFFEHYKDLDSGKWTKVNNWKNINTAKMTILDAYERFKKSKS